MNPIHYAIQDWHQVPAELDWLTPVEQRRADGFRFEKRRRDWLLGRWTAKIALLGITGLSHRNIARIEIASAPDGAPQPVLDGERCGVEVSLSHSNKRAFATVSQGTGALGCDIELVEPRSPAFIETYFTAAEAERIQRVGPGDRDTLVTMIWSAKESTLKALRTGLQADTRSVEVIDDGVIRDSGWNTARTTAARAGAFSCLWRRDGQFVLSFVTRAPIETPRSVTGAVGIGQPLRDPVYRQIDSSGACRKSKLPFPNFPG